MSAAITPRSHPNGVREAHQTEENHDEIDSHALGKPFPGDVSAPVCGFNPDDLAGVGLLDVRLVGVRNLRVEIGEEGTALVARPENTLRPVARPDLISMDDVGEVPEAGGRSPTSPPEPSVELGQAPPRVWEHHHFPLLEPPVLQPEHRELRRPLSPTATAPTPPPTARQVAEQQERQELVWLRPVVNSEEALRSFTFRPFRLGLVAELEEPC